MREYLTGGCRGTACPEALAKLRQALQERLSVAEERRKVAAKAARATAVAERDEAKMQLLARRENGVTSFRRGSRESLRPRGRQRGTRSDPPGLRDLPCAEVASNRLG